MKTCDYCKSVEDAARGLLNFERATRGRPTARAIGGLSLFLLYVGGITTSKPAPDCAACRKAGRVKPLRLVKEVT